MSDYQKYQPWNPDPEPKAEPEPEFKPYEWEKPQVPVDEKWDKATDAVAEPKPVVKPEPKPVVKPEPDPFKTTTEKEAAKVEAARLKVERAAAAAEEKPNPDKDEKDKAKEDRAAAMKVLKESEEGVTVKVVKLANPNYTNAHQVTVKVGAVAKVYQVWTFDDGRGLFVDGKQVQDPAAFNVGADPTAAITKFFETFPEYRG